jgi:hypothetical protein
LKGAKLTCIAMVMSGFLGLGTLSVSAGNTYYRWVDDRGNPVHSDRPPPEGVDYEVVSTQSTMVRQVEAEEGAVPADIKHKQGNEVVQVDSETLQINKTPEYCQRARDNLATLNETARIRMRDENGEYYYLTEEQKAKQRSNAESAIARHCD